MANDLGNISSASVPYMVSNDKSGLQAAQSLDTPSDLALNRVKMYIVRRRSRGRTKMFLPIEMGAEI